MPRCQNSLSKPTATAREGSALSFAPCTYFVGVHEAAVYIVASFLFSMPVSAGRKSVKVECVFFELMFFEIFLTELFLIHTNES